MAYDGELGGLAIRFGCERCHCSCRCGHDAKVNLGLRTGCVYSTCSTCKIEHGYEIRRTCVFRLSGPERSRISLGMPERLSLGRDKCMA
jgi:hypothetical protein